jgi:hypothetical protein
MDRQIGQVSKGSSVAITETLDTLYLCWFCKPKSQRELFRLVRRHRIRSIVELGLHSTERSLRLIRMARRSSPGTEIHYGGIDLFEARPADRPRVTLKQTYQALTGHGASVRLIPGDVAGALTRYANQLRETQLLLIAPDHDPGLLQRAWRYVPRMLGANAIVLQATGDGEQDGFRRIARHEIDGLAAATERQQRAA